MDFYSVKERSTTFRDSLRVILPGTYMPFDLIRHTRTTIEKHFKKRAFIWSEDYFLSILDAPRSKHDVYWATIGLREVGTNRSIPVLQKFITYPMQDVQCTSVLTIAHIGRESATPFLAETLLNPKYRQKDYAMWAIMDAADERAIPAVLEYFSKNKSKLRTGKLMSFGHGMCYLAKFMDSNSEARQFIDELAVYWRKLLPGQRTQMKKDLPELWAKMEAQAL